MYSFSFGGAYSTRTYFGSTSSYSAISVGVEVSVPCPIST